jgi:O-antigen ligase
MAALAVIERRRWRWARAPAVLAVLALLSTVVFAVALPEFARGYWARFGFTLDNFLVSPDRVLSGRLETWSTIAAFITSHPWQTVFGIGYKTLPYSGYPGKPIVADNMYLSLLVETGVLGLAALMALNVAVLVTCWRAMRRGSFYGKWLFCFWTGEVFQMLSADLLTYWRVLPVYFWVLAQAARDAHEHADTSDRSVQ